MELKNNYALYIPSTINGEYISDGKHADWCEKYAKIMLENFLGLTVSAAFGYWKSSNTGKITAEKVYIIKASSNFHAEGYIGLLAKRVKSEMEQEAVSYEINGVLHII